MRLNKRLLRICNSSLIARLIHSTLLLMVMAICKARQAEAGAKPTCLDDSSKVHREVAIFARGQRRLYGERYAIMAKIYMFAIVRAFSVAQLGLS
jgi:hypothetical protein